MKKNTDNRDAFSACFEPIVPGRQLTDAQWGQIAEKDRKHLTYLAHMEQYFEWQLETWQSDNTDVSLFQTTYLLPEVLEHRDNTIQSIFELLDLSVEYDVDFTDPIRDLPIQYS